MCSILPRAGPGPRHKSKRSGEAEAASDICTKFPDGASTTPAFVPMAMMSGGGDDDREKELADCMSCVGQDVAALMSMARDIGAELETQNRQIRTIAETVHPLMHSFSC